MLSRPATPWSRPTRDRICRRIGLAGTFRCGSIRLSLVLGPPKALEVLSDMSQLIMSNNVVSLIAPRKHGIGDAKRLDESPHE